MNVDVSSRGIKITPDVKDYINKKLSRLDRFTSRPLNAKVMLKVDAKKAKVEVTIPVGKLIIRAEEADKELFNAVDKCALRLETQLKNNKHKLVRSLQEKQGISDLFIPEPEPKEMVTSAVKIKEYKLEVLSFDEAVTALELTQHSFYVYKDEEEHVCVVYLREDGEYGLIRSF